MSQNEDDLNGKFDILSIGSPPVFNANSKDFMPIHKKPQSHQGNLSPRSSNQRPLQGNDTISNIDPLTPMIDIDVDFNQISLSLNKNIIRINRDIEKKNSHQHSRSPSLG